MIWLNHLDLPFCFPQYLKLAKLIYKEKNEKLTNCQLNYDFKPLLERWLPNWSQAWVFSANTEA